MALVLKSPLFFNLKTHSSSLAYPGPYEELTRNSLACLLKTDHFKESAYFDRICEFRKPADTTNESGSPVVMKLLKTIKQDDGGKAFFFALSNYENRLRQRQVLLDKGFKMLSDNGKHGVRAWTEIKIGQMLGVYNEEKRFVRIRVVQLDLSNETLSYWAVDEAELGQHVGLQNLYFLNDFLYGLNMLALPGVFEDEPPQTQMSRFKEKKYCIAIVREPYLCHDNAPRLVRFENN